MRFPKGTILVRKNEKFNGEKAGTPAWEKISDEDWGWWVSLDSHYLIETVVQEEVTEIMKMVNPRAKHQVESVEIAEPEDDVKVVTVMKDKKPKMRNVTVYTSHPESEKPLYNEKGNLNRYGFRQMDDGVHEQYKNLMDFKIPSLS